MEGHDYDGMPLGEKSVDHGGGDADVEIDDDGVNSLNASYEEVENQTNNTVDFRGERMELAMHFNHPAFSMDYVCDFVLKAPVSGWVIAVQDNFNTASILCSDEKTYRSAMKYCFKNAVRSTRFAANKVRLCN